MQIEVNEFMKIYGNDNEPRYIVKKEVNKKVKYIKKKGITL